VYDSSIHGGTTGTYFNTSETWVTNPAGLSNTALHFGGNGSGAYLDTGNSTLFNFTTNSFTINLWLNPSNYDSYVMGNNEFQSNGWFLSVNNDDQLYFGSDASGSETVLVAAKPDGWPNSYNMVTITRNSTDTPLVYINGLPVVTSGSFANPASSSNSLKFGTGTNQYGTYILDGNIWLPQIWTNVLSSANIANLYQEQLSGVPWP
jgi:hypothetical protein